jgi:hypothetical protein
MNINATASSVLVAGFDTLEPENARDDRIATSRILGEHFAAEISSLEDRALRKFVAQL